jgi:hypothetical protein
METKRTKRVGSARVEAMEALSAPSNWLNHVRDPVIVVVKSAQGGKRAPCQVFGVDPEQKELIFAAEGTAPGLLQRLAPEPGRGTVLVIEVAGLLPLHAPSEGEQPPVGGGRDESGGGHHEGPHEGSTPGDPPPIRPGGADLTAASAGLRKRAARR